MFRSAIASDPVLIDAPMESVWAILVNVDRYAEWNPFARTYRETNMRVGCPVHLEVTLGGRVQRQTQWLEVIDPPMRLAWSTTVGHRRLFRARREQRLRKRTDTSCVYLNSDTFEGPLAPFVTLLFGRAVRDGFAAAGRALKQRAEQCR